MPARLLDFLSADGADPPRDPEVRLSTVLSRCRDALGLERASVWVAGPYGAPRCRVAVPAGDVSGAGPLAGLALDMAGNVMNGDLHPLEGTAGAFVPLTSGGAFPGVLLMERAASGWSDEDRLIAALAAERLVAVLEHADRVRAERRLADRERILEDIGQVAGLGMWEWDVATNLIAWSDQQCRIHGIDPADAPTDFAGYLSFVHPEDQARVVSECEDVLRTGTPFWFRYRIIRRDGVERWVNGHGRVFRDEANNPLRMVGTVQDITERLAADEALHRAYAELEERVEERTLALAEANEALAREIEEQRVVEAELAKARDAAEDARATAEQANRAKSEFLSRMSHELRTPMNSILGFAQVLEAARLSDKHGRSVQHILRAGRHLLQLINEVLEIARIEAGRHHFSLEPVRLAQVLQEAVAMVKPLAAQGDVRIDEPLGFEDDPFVRADRQRLVQVLLNLLSNGIKYNGRGGHVHVSVERIEDAQRGARRVVRVRDTGPGIPADRVGQLFTPFSRLGAEQSQVEGTGLGLALSQRLAEAMGGGLSLEATGPSGSMFALDLEAAENPVARGEPGSERPTSLDGVAHADATLLYIEDNLANLTLVETILEARPKWRTLPALQGELGLELARQHLPDLILLDLHLPDISGEEVLRRLRADARTMHIPVIVISADATPSSIDRLLASGASAFLTKPIDIAQFVTAIERLLPAAATENRTESPNAQPL